MSVADLITKKADELDAMLPDTSLIDEALTEATASINGAVGKINTMQAQLAGATASMQAELQKEMKIIKDSLTEQMDDLMQPMQDQMTEATAQASSLTGMATDLQNQATAASSMLSSLVDPPALVGKVLSLASGGTSINLETVNAMVTAATKMSAAADKMSAISTKMSAINALKGMLP